MTRFAELMRVACVAALPVLGALWLADVPQYVGLVFVDAAYLNFMAGITIAAGFLGRPYRQRLGVLEVLLALTAIAAWTWSAYNYEDWLIDIANRGPEKWLPGAVGLALMLEALRRTCGTPITLLVAVIALYGFVGHNLPGALEAAYTAPDRLVLYLYADTNGVPGIVLGVGVTIVLAFVLLGSVMGEVGSSAFFTDLAMASMGHRRGGPAKVAVTASSLFGMISGSTIGNVMTTGIITIPLMKKSGFPKHVAAAIEAVASNGGQLAPPVMGATAFLIAEFLQVSYAEVVAAAIIPAAVYYLVLFLQVDLIAQRHDLHGLPRADLPRLAGVVAKGWPYVLPLALLIYLLFWLGYSPGKSALYAAGLTLVIGLLGQRRKPDRALVRGIVMGAGRGLVPLLLICAAAGVVIGILNITGLGFLLTNVLTKVGESGGLLVMLGLTALIAIFLGMGMPTAAVYVVLSIILAPAIVKMGVPAMAAHLFIFYFGLLSMLTPPVAIASYAAGGLAGAGLWETGLAGLRLGASAYILPFLFALNPALVGQGSWVAVGIVFVTTVMAGYLLAHALVPEGDGTARDWGRGGLLFAGAVVVGGATLWTGPESPLALAPAGLALIVLVYRSRILKQRQEVSP